MSRGEEGKESEENAQNDVENADGKPPLLDEGQGLQREGGKCCKAAANARLQKENEARIDVAVLARNADNKTNRKASDDVDCKGGERKSATEFRKELSEEIAANRTKRTAEPDRKEIHHASPARR